MTPREKLEVKVGKENAAKWINMVKEGIKPEATEGGKTA